MRITHLLLCALLLLSVLVVLDARRTDGANSRATTKRSSKTRADSKTAGASATAAAAGAAAGGSPSLSVSTRGKRSRGSRSNSTSASASAANAAPIKGGKGPAAPSAKEGAQIGSNVVVSTPLANKRARGSSPNPALNWQSPSRRYSRGQLRRRINDLVPIINKQKGTPKKPRPAGPRSSAARAGQLPRPTKSSGKFNPKAAAKYFTNAMGRVGGGSKKSSSKSAARATEAAGSSSPIPPAANGGKRRGKAARSFMETGASHSAGDAPAIQLQTTFSDVKLPSGLQLTGAKIKAIQDAMWKYPTTRVFYHWAGYQSSIRWGRNGKIEKGEIDWIDTQTQGMASGGGYYLAGNPKSSAPYGPVPCYITVPVGTPFLDIPQTAIKNVLGQTLNDLDKTALGQIIPFVHLYNKDNQWYVTHHWQTLSNIRCGNAIITPDPTGSKAIDNPTVNIDGAVDVRRNGVPAGSLYVSIHFDNMNGQVVAKDEIKNSLDLHAYVLRMSTEQWDSMNAQLGQDVNNAASWLNSFFVLMSYIDGLSLVRAKTVAPSDPWSVFEPQNFGNFKKTFDSYILKKKAGTSWGIATRDAYGTGSDALAWAKNMVEKFIPQLYNDLSGGSELRYRTDSCRAGGPEMQDAANKWTTGYFFSTPGQTQVMQKNQYLSVESASYPEGAAKKLELVAYYYPDPLRFAAVKSYVSTSLQADIAAAGNYTGPDGKQQFVNHTQLLIKELLIHHFKAELFGKGVCTGPGNIQGALFSALQLVSIHPYADFNGRSTRFFMLLAALEGCGEVPISFMSDFDTVTQFNRYNQFIANGMDAYFQLKLAMLSEMISALANNNMGRQWDLPEWSTFMSTALKGFGTNKKFDTRLTDEENDMVRSRKFVPLMDRWFGTEWAGRNSP